LKFRQISGALRTQHSSLLSSLALASVSIAIFCGYWFFSRSQPRTQAQLPPLPQDEAIQVYFNHNQAAEFVEPYRQKTRRGDDLAARLIAAINAAQSQIDVAVQELQLPNIAQALADKAQSGVRVRVILENNYSQPLSELSAAAVDNLAPRAREKYAEFRRLVDIDRDGTLSQAEIDRRDALVILRRGRVQVLDDTADSSKGSGLMHHKFMVVDGYNVSVTSANWTMSDVYGDPSRLATEGNANNLVQMQSAELARAFTEEFNLMWGDGTLGNSVSQFKARKPARPLLALTVGKTRVLVQFSPTSPQQAWADSSNGTIGKFLESSQEQVNLALFVFSEPALGNILLSQSQRGVKVRGLIDRQFAYRDYSSGLLLMGVDGENLCQPSQTRVPTVETIGVPNLPTGDVLHHKFAVLDRRTVIAGSHNWSNAANYRNDETLLTIENNPTIAAHFDREFDRLYQNAVFGIPAKLHQKHCKSTELDDTSN
jgi:phosphatidylserine/phosphatidylglycerophosphate/cardiolipin synthase-like enzyme